VLNNNTLFGFVLSCRKTLKLVTVNEQVAVLPVASVAVQVTVVVPTGSGDPDGGTHTVVTPGQLSDAVGAGKLTTLLVAASQGAPAAGGGVTTTRLVGQVIVGGCVSATVTVKLQLGPAVAVQVTVVVPTGKKEPEGGVQVMVPQVPVVVGAG
jgi:hypothetical protein